MNELELRPMDHSVASVLCAQNIFNHSGGYSQRLFGHPLNGREGAEFFPLFSREEHISTLNVNEILLKGAVSVSVGLIATKHFSNMEQTFISLILVDSRYRRRQLGTRAIQQLEELMAQHSKFASLKVATANEGARHFWKQLDYVDESEWPESKMPIFTVDANQMRLVKKLAPTGQPNDLTRPMTATFPTPTPPGWAPRVWTVR